MSKIFQKNSNTPILTIKQRRNLRKNSGNTTIVVSDRTEYLPLGGGFTTSNHPILSRFKTDSLIQKVINLEKIVPANINVIKKELINMTTKPNLKLKLDDNFQPIIIEETHNIVLNLKLNKGF